MTVIREFCKYLSKFGLNLNFEIWEKNSKTTQNHDTLTEIVISHRQGILHLALSSTAPEQSPSGMTRHRREEWGCVLLAVEVTDKESFMASSWTSTWSWPRRRLVALTPASSVHAYSRHHGSQRPEPTAPPPSCVQQLQWPSRLEGVAIGSSFSSVVEEDSVDCVPNKVWEGGWGGGIEDPIKFERVGEAVALKTALKTSGEGYGNQAVFTENPSVFIKLNRFSFFMIFTTFCTSTNFAILVVSNFWILVPPKILK
jgi:hypothetical protein